MGRIAFGGQHTPPFAQGPDIRLTHQPGYSFAGGSVSLIFQFTMNAWTPVSASMGHKDLPNFLCELSIFSGMLAGRTLAPGRESAFGNVKHLAHHHDGKFVLVLFNKLIFHLLSREKMLTTF